MWGDYIMVTLLLFLKEDRILFAFWLYSDVFFPHIKKQK